MMGYIQFTYELHTGTYALHMYFIIMQLHTNRLHTDCMQFTYNFELTSDLDTNDLNCIQITIGFQISYIQSTKQSVNYFRVQIVHCQSQDATVQKQLLRLSRFQPCIFNSIRLSNLSSVIGKISESVQ